jgi:hypothetical protein
MMTVAGAAFIGRRDFIVKERGEEAWKAFMMEAAGRDPVFQQPIFATTRIPADVYVTFNDALIQRFYGGDQRMHWTFGERAAEFSFEHGTYRTMKSQFLGGNYEKFIAGVPGIWRSYYSEGRAVGTLRGRVAEVQILGASPPHVYFEFTTLGYVKRALELAGAEQVTTKALRGFSLGHDEAHYQFLIGG